MTRNKPIFSRKSPSKKEEPRVLFVCEDEKSSRDYLQEAAQHYRSNAVVRVIHIGKTNPLGIVSHCVTQLRNYEEVWYVIDRDRHERFDEAIEEARKHATLSSCVSYPCFEIWLKIHFEYSTKEYVEEGNKSPADCVTNDLEQYELLQGYKKGKVTGLFDKLSDHLGTAIKNAALLRSHADSVSNKNPSTEIDRVIARLKELGLE